MMCYDAEIPMSVLGTPEEVAETVVWMYVFSFLSVVNESGYINKCLSCLIGRLLTRASFFAESRRAMLRIRSLGLMGDCSLNKSSNREWSATQR